MGNGVQVRQSSRVRKNPSAQGLPVQLARFYHAGEPAFDGGKQGFVGFQQVVIDGVAVQTHAAQAMEGLQGRGLAAAGAAGDTEDHASASASTIWKAAAFFSRFWTA